MVSYFVDQARAGRGLATEAVREVVVFAFRVLGLHRVEAGTAVANVASQRVLEHNGFTRVGLLRRHLLLQGEWVDHYLWERLADDPHERSVSRACGSTRDRCGTATSETSGSARRSRPSAVRSARSRSRTRSTSSPARRRSSDCSGSRRSCPLLVVPLIGGAIADALDRRTVLLRTEIGMALITALFLANSLLPHPQVWALFVLESFSVAMFSLGRPAMSSLAPRLVPDERSPRPAPSTASTTRSAPSPALRSGAS